MRSVVCFHFARLPIPPEYLPDPPRILRVDFALVLRRFIETTHPTGHLGISLNFSGYRVNRYLRRTTRG